ncbi:MAG TPA: TonB-dependent receptor [Flavobacteriia bacterium]|nr:TonB-dependent receptor [Flavobacteriia bacterium]
MKKLVIGIFLLTTTILYAQNKTIKGKVIDKKTQKPIENVLIKQKKSSNFTITNAQGEFEISTSLDTNFFIIHMNYKEKSIPLTDNIIIELTEKPVNLDAIIVTANPLKDIAVSTTIIDNTKAVSQPRNVTDLFKEIKGFGIQKRGAYASEPIFRAFRYEQLNIRYDGASKTVNACPNRMDPITTHIIPEEIEKIELVKGPFTVRFGQNFGGIINLVTKEPNKDKQGLSGSVEGGYETNGQNKTTRAALLYNAKKWDVFANGSYRDYGNYTDGNGMEVPASFKTTDYSVKLGYKPTEKQRLRLSWRQSFGKDIMHAGLPMDSPYDNSYLANLDYKVDQISNIINSVTVKSYFSKVDHLMTNENRPNFGMVAASTNVFSTTYGGKAEVSISPNDQSMLFTGIDADFTGRTGDRIKLVKVMNGMALPTPIKKIEKVWQDAQINILGAFAEYKYLFNGRTTLTTGLRSDFVSAGINDPAQQMTDLYGEIKTKNEVNISGNISVKHKIKNGQIQLAFGRGTKTASMIERFINHFSIGVDPYEYIGNPNLKPEINNQVELSFQKQFSQIELGGSVFYSYIQDYITAFVNTNIPRLYMPMMQPQFTKQFINVDKAVQSGFEFYFNYHATNYLSFNTDVSYTYAQNKEFNEPLPQIQPMTANINTVYEKKNYWFKLHAHFVARQDRIATSFAENETPSYALFDFSAGIKPTKNLSLGASVLNIFDKAYYDHLNFSYKNADALNGKIYEPGRNLTFYAKYSF